MSPEVSIILKYLMASPSERGKYKQDIIKMAKYMYSKAMRDGEGSVADIRHDEFGELLAYYKDIEAFVIPEMKTVYAGN